jgi:hypothetical protein
MEAQTVPDLSKLLPGTDRTGDKQTTLLVAYQAGLQFLECCILLSMFLMVLYKGCCFNPAPLPIIVLGAIICLKIEHILHVCGLRQQLGHKTS